MKLLCPICGRTLLWQGKSCRCENNHSFDVARQGYVNLLAVQQKHSLHPGDTREQVLARRAFLDTGAYGPLLESILQLLRDHHARGPVLDVGCGEGYYGSAVARELGAELTGLDISKEAVRCAAGRYKDALWLCGTAAHLPIGEEEAGLLMSMFALTLPQEFARVLAIGGLFLQVTAREDHLLGLKSVIYPKLTGKEKSTEADLPGFQLLEQRDVEFDLSLEGSQVQNLLYMTPHVYRISAEGLARLQALESLRDRACCRLRLYKRI